MHLLQKTKDREQHQWQKDEYMLDHVMITLHLFPEFSRELADSTDEVISHCKCRQLIAVTIKWYNNNNEKFWVETTLWLAYGPGSMKCMGPSLIIFKISYLTLFTLLFYSFYQCHVSLEGKDCTACDALSCSCLLGKWRPSQLWAPWFHCLYRLSAQAISLCSAFMGNLGLLGVHSLEQIYHRNTGRQFNNAPVDSWEKPGIYLM